MILSLNLHELIGLNGEIRSKGMCAGFFINNSPIGHSNNRKHILKIIHQTVKNLLHKLQRCDFGRPAQSDIIPKNLEVK